MEKKSDQDNSDQDKSDQDFGKLNRFAGPWL